MSPAKANTQAIPSKDQVDMIRSAIQNSLAGLLKALFTKEHYAEVKLFPNGVDLIDVQVTVGLPSAPVVDFQLKITGPGQHAGAVSG